MLCTPPAFILSQDQTLEKWYIKCPQALNIFLSSLIALLLFVWVVFSKNCEICSCTYYMLCTSLIVVQFSMTERSLLTASLPFGSRRLFRDSLSIISQRLRFVNPFFKSFLKTFFRGRLSSALGCCSSWQLVYYSIHTFFCQLWVVPKLGTCYKHQMTFLNKMTKMASPLSRRCHFFSTKQKSIT